MTKEAIEEEYWIDYYRANQGKEEVEDDDFDMDEALRQAEQSGTAEDDWEDVTNNGKN